MTDPNPDPDPDRFRSGQADLTPIALADERTRRRLRLGGMFQIALGVFLIGLIGIVTWRMAPQLLAAPAATADGSRFNASAGTARLVLGLLGSVMLFGAVAVAIGVNQAGTGRRPRRLVYLLWAAAGLILLMTLLTVMAIKLGQG